MMNELIRLVNLLEKRAKKAVGNYVNFSDDNLEAKLYLLIKEKQVNTDTAAMQALYGSEREAKGYKMLKSRLVKKLFAAIDKVELSEKEFLPFAQAEQQCLAILNRVLTLLRVGEDQLAHKFVQQAIAIGRKLNNAALLVRSYELAYRAAGGIREESLFKLYEKELKHYKQILDLEFEADEVYQNARLYLLDSTSSRAVIIDKLPKILQEMETKWAISNSPRIFTCWQYIFNIYHETAGNFEEVIRNADAVEKMVLTKQISELNVDLRYYKFVKLYALQQLHRYEEGLSFAQSIENSFIYGSTSWASYLENYFLLALHSRSYKLAGQLIHKFFSSGVDEILSLIMKERWILNIRYYNLVAPAFDDALTPINDERVNSFKIRSSDKIGFNVALIVLDIFKLLEQEVVLEITSHSDRIRKYTSKYLNKAEAERPRLFMKLLLLVLRENLDASACRTKGRYLYQKLKSTPFQVSAFLEVEIVPYEQLWELVLLKLDKRQNSRN